MLVGIGHTVKRVRNFYLVSLDCLLGICFGSIRVCVHLFNVRKWRFQRTFDVSMKLNYMTLNYIEHCWISESRLSYLWGPPKKTISRTTHEKSTHTHMDDGRQTVNFHFFSCNWEVYILCSHSKRTAFFSLLTSVALFVFLWFNARCTHNEQHENLRIISTLM